MKVTVSLGLISSVPVVPSAASFQPELLIALAISPAVASAFGAAGVFTLPSVLVVNGAVTAAMLPLSSTLTVVLSVFAATV